MIIAKLSWLEPEEDWCFATFNDADESDLQKIVEFVQKEAGDNYGGTVPSIELIYQFGETVQEKQWQYLGDAIRYCTGEEIYKSECKELKAHGIERI